MFRPYSLTSLAAWTVGSLAGNHAYYSTLTSSTRTRVSKSTSPPSVRALVNRLRGVELELQEIAQSFSSAVPQPGHINVTPFVQVKVYRDWFADHRDPIHEEIERTYKATMAAGYLWPDNIIQTAQSAFQDTLNRLDTLADESNALFQSIVQSTDQHEKQLLIDAVLKFQNKHKVSSKSWKLLRPKDPARLIIQNKHHPAIKAAAGAPPSREWQREMKCPNCASRIGYNLEERGNSFTCQCGASVVLW